MSTYCIFSALYAPHLGGVETYTEGLARELVARGNRVIVATSHISCDTPVEQTDANGIEILRFPCIPLLHARLPLPQHNMQTHQLLARIAEARPSRVIVNTRFYGHSLMGARFAASEQIPCIVIEHGSAHLSFGSAVPDIFAQRYEHAITKHIVATGARFAGVSQAANTWLSHFGLNAVGCIPNAIDAQTYRLQASMRDFRSELRLEHNDLLIAIAGRLVPGKGIEAVLQAAAYTKTLKTTLPSSAHTPAKTLFAFAGDGPLSQSIDQAHQAGSDVCTLGRLSSADMAALYAASNAYLLPSRSEGFATTLLEACSLGTFPIATNIGGVAELGIGRIGGILLPDDSPISITAAIDVVAHHADLCHKQARALQQVADTCTWAASADALESFFTT